MNASMDTIRFGGSILGDYRHVCAFFNSAEDEYRVLMPFISEGFARGDRAYHVMEPARAEPHLARLRDVGIDVEATTASGQFEMHVPGDTYLRGGRFAKEGMLALLQGVLETGLARKFPLTRLVAHAESVLDSEENLQPWLEYESRLNQMFPVYQDVLICAYTLDRLAAATAIDILRTHPVAILGGLLQENPFFVPPETFLRELETRSGSDATEGAV